MPIEQALGCLQVKCGPRSSTIFTSLVQLTLGKSVSAPPIDVSSIAFGSYKLVHRDDESEMTELHLTEACIRSEHSDIWRTTDLPDDRLVKSVF